MQIKTNLHFHTGDDENDPIDYSTYEAIDKSAELGFGAIAITCHGKCAWTEEYAKYAAEKGILLIPGIESFIGETVETAARHTLILNATKEAEQVHTFEQLAEYRKLHPECFVIAPHPYFYGNFSLKEFLGKYIKLYDGIELSWFYSRWFNRNIGAELVAQKFHLPFIATSDTHYFDFLDKNYCTVDAEENTPDAIFKAFRGGYFLNTTSRRNFWLDMVFRQGAFFVKEYFWRKRGRPKIVQKPRP